MIIFFIIFKLLLILLIILCGSVNLHNKLFSVSRINLLELMMVKVSDKSSVNSEEMNVFIRHADFLAGCFQEKCGAVLKLTAAGDAEDEV